MAPSLYRRAGDNALSAHTSARLEARDDGASTAINPWLIVVIVIGSLAVTTSVALLVFYFVRRRRLRIAQDGQIDPLGRGNLRKRGMSTSDRLAAEEMERATMIRKSLASRASSWSGVSSSAPETSEYHMEELDRDEHEATTHGNNWKEFEAGSQHQGTVHEPFDTEMGVHPALLPQPQLSVPQPPRAASPMRGIQPPHLIIPS
ncbi:hypothetical protein GGR52DRAFT_459413 [Hypoxylon sp. FL1284]|nr:hypothetical protein GGR52DRAFT_459413 [Hypoxylon sp. FL1284]